MPSRIHDIRTKMSEQELARWKAEFFEVHTPIALAECVQQFGSIVGDHAVDSSRAGFWRDAHLASNFGIHRKASRILMLGPENDANHKIAPDFQIEVDGTWARYELVEALPVGRRRSDEFREDREAGGGKARSDHVPNKTELTEILSKAAAIKVAKSTIYSDCRGLVIKLSTWALLSDEAKEEVLTSGTEQAGKIFGEVWVIDGSVTYLVWCDGHPAYRLQR
ncbi:hypothetical protein [Sandarakinorhabdus sp.]|uniref:hypothetical protein n=1 Tax=Sandarakinorhabdus sp. TaxID=1916663 RepID=UPI00286E697F|nr:hypothetical protein [Sandarakinorhabdus sp.]